MLVNAGKSDRRLAVVEHEHLDMQAAACNKRVTQNSASDELMATCKTF